MNTLEKYLIKEGILEKFLKNVNVKYEEMDIASAFMWSDTEEGRNFWRRHYDCEKGLIKRSRVIRLLQERIPRFRGEVL